ncbi:MAG TPA: exodeoxyribonuclease VII large subunit [Gammaproteobacteria bacterium]|nr:exodeoxyribonuclease VII large subunit [Gammaproteobacteria bacterium]
MSQPSSGTSGISAVPPAREVYTVSRLNREARALLEGSFPVLWVEGELSNFARPGSGHWYFTLKDAQAQVRAAMFRAKNALLKWTPEEGTQVLVRARVSLYEGRGEFQLIVEHMEPAGEGLLRLQFERLKQKLAAEGLFDEAYKQPLPAFPRCLGVITSPTGAAIRDVLSVLRRRYPLLPVIIYPAPVQGADAAPQIAAIIRAADRRKECDVLLLTRGGGSLEDLWPFNEEIVARAIYDCAIPIVSGVGHEIDFTIADFVADIRAPTPSAAAELISPDGEQLVRHYGAIASRLSSLIKTHLRREREQLTWLSKRLIHPARRLMELSQRVDDFNQRLLKTMRHQFDLARSAVVELNAHLRAASPLPRLRLHAQHQTALRGRLQQAVMQRLRAAGHELVQLGRALSAVSPLATLDRGYAIVTTDQGQIARDASTVKTGSRVQARLAKGELDCVVETVRPVKPI